MSLQKKKKTKTDILFIKKPIKRKKRQTTEWEDTLKHRYLIKKTKNIFPEYIYRTLINHGTREMGKRLEQAYHKKDDLNVQ